MLGQPNVDVVRSWKDDNCIGTERKYSPRTRYAVSNTHMEREAVEIFR